MTASERMKALRLRKEAQGLRQVLVWVPAERVEELRTFANVLRLEAERAREEQKRTDGER